MHGPNIKYVNLCGLKIAGKTVDPTKTLIFIRLCNKKVVADLSYPESLNREIKDEIAKCARIAAAASVAAALAGRAADATPVFEATFNGCASAKISEWLSQIKIDINSTSTFTGWKRI